MGNNISKWKFSIIAVSSVIIIACGGNGPSQTTEPIPEQKTPVEETSDDKNQEEPTNGAIIFIDKSASIQKVDSVEVSKASGQIFKKIKDFIGDTGAEVSIYFIHKDLAGASPFFKIECVMPDTKNLTSFPAAAAKNKYKGKVESIKTKIEEAIKTPKSQPTSSETDLWITIKKAEDGFVNLPQSGKRLFVYYSDMIESVSKSKCGKDYEGNKFKDVPEAIAMGKKDATPIKQCYDIEKLSGPTEVFLCFRLGRSKRQNILTCLTIGKRFFRNLA